MATRMQYNEKALYRGLQRVKMWAVVVTASQNFCGIKIPFYSPNPALHLYNPSATITNMGCGLTAAFTLNLVRLGRFKSNAWIKHVFQRTGRDSSHFQELRLVGMAFKKKLAPLASGENVGTLLRLCCCAVFNGILSSIIIRRFSYNHIRELDIFPVPISQFLSCHINLSWRG